MLASTCQSVRRERKGRGISLCMDWSAWRTRGSPEEANSMHWERAVSMMLIKRDGGSKVTPSLSAVSEGRRSGQ